MLHFLMNLILGGLAGYIAGKIMNSEGGMVRNVVLGLIGGVIGGALLGLLGLGGAVNWLGQVIVSVVGACVLIWVARKLL